MLKKIQNRKQSGFTIIEVLIVLAIAGLILLIVFLAVPSLERSQRNTGRKEDAGRLVTAINDYVSNSNGDLPSATDTSWTTGGACVNILNDAGTLNQGTWTSSDCSVTVQGANNFDIESGAITGAAGATTVTDQTSGFEAILDVGAQCSTSSSDTTVAGTSRQAALLYDLEVGGGGDENWTCINAE